MTHDQVLDGLDSGIRYRNVDGTWETIRSEPVHTGDPELDYLWDVQLDELNTILEDPENPLHEKAKVVLGEMFAPLFETVKGSQETVAAAADATVRPAVQRLNERVASIVRESLPSFPAALEAPRPPIVHPASGHVDVVSSTGGAVEIEGLTVNSTASDVRVTVDAVARDALERIAVATEEQLEHAQTVETNRQAEASEQTARAKRTEIAGWIAAFGAVGAVVATIIFGLVTLL